MNGFFVTELFFDREKKGKLARVEAIFGERSLGLSGKELCFAEKWRKSPFRFGHRIKKVGRQD